jgi:uncharacterized membrane protein
VAPPFLAQPARVIEDSAFEERTNPMREWVYVTVYWAHLIATVTWIGGIIFILLVAIPASQHILGSDAGKLMGEISKRFTPLANSSIFLLVITGIVLAGSTRRSGILALDTNWTRILIIKLLLFSGMVAIHFYRGLVLSPKIMKVASDTEKASLQKLSLNLVKVNCGLGLMVLLVTGIMSVL